MRRPILALLLAFPAFALAQKTVAVHVPPGDVVAFATAGRATAAPVDPVVAKDGVASVSVGDGKTMLYIWDRSFNRVASVPVKGTEWKPQVEDLKDLAQVVVEIRNGASNPVAAANVTLDDGRRKQDQFLDPSAKGDATFFDVKAGQLKVTVKFRSNGKDAQPVTQLFTADAKGDTPPKFTVVLPGDVATIGPPMTATGGAVDPKAPVEADKGGGGFNFIGTLFALLVGGGAAAGIYFYIKKNPDAVGGTLEKLGAQIPKPGDADLLDPPVAAAPPPKAPEPPQKIVLDPVADPIQMPVPIAVAVAEPSLISEAGIPIPLAEGETVVGREVGLGLSLAGETTVSRRHARLVRSGSSVTVSDEGSTNGTFVNGAPAGSGTALRPGDAVQFGSVRFRYEA